MRPTSLDPGRKDEACPPARMHGRQDQRKEDGRRVPSPKPHDRRPDRHRRHAGKQQCGQHPGESGQGQHGPGCQAQHRPRNGKMPSTQRSRMLPNRHRLHPAVVEALPGEGTQHTAGSAVDHRIGIEPYDLSPLSQPAVDFVVFVTGQGIAGRNYYRHREKATLRVGSIRTLFRAAQPCCQVMSGSVIHRLSRRRYFMTLSAFQALPYRFVIFVTTQDVDLGAAGFREPSPGMFSRTLTRPAAPGKRGRAEPFSPSPLRGSIHVSVQGIFGAVGVIFCGLSTGVPVCFRGLCALDRLVTRRRFGLLGVRAAWRSRSCGRAAWRWR